MQAALCAGQHIGLVFNGPGAQQHFPVCLTGGVGEGGGYQYQVCFEQPVQLGKAKVVAHAQAHGHRVAIAGCAFERHGDGACLQHRSLVITLGAVVKAEQVDLVVTGHAFAVRVVGQYCIGHAIGQIGDQRQGAAHHPQPEVAGRALQHGLDGAMAGRLGPGQLVGVALAHEAEVFGQHGQLGTLVGGLRQQVSGGGEVGGHVSA